MIDVHTHIMPFIDDGSESIEDSMAMIETEIANGVHNIILTPHALRVNIKKYSLEHLLNSFNKFKAEVEAKYDVRLYLGQEISFHHSIINALKKKQVLSMNNSEYILLELPFSEAIEDFDELFYSCQVLGYKLIIAHVERYSYLTNKDLERLRSYGVLFQINSSSITGKNGNAIQKKTFNLFKKNYVDLVGSDIHAFRENTMAEAYKMVEKKFGNLVANNVFKENAKKYLNIK